MRTLLVDRRRARGKGRRAGEPELLAPGLLHELRQPLTGLDAGLKLLAREGGDAVTGLAGWKVAAGQAARMAEVLDTYQQLMSGDGGARLRFAADVAARSAIAVQRHRLEPMGERFALVVERDVPVAWGSPLALQHAVTNLLGNALDAVEESGREGRIEVRVLAAPGRAAAQVRVADDGDGIPDEIRATLFTPRVTTKLPGRGSGLGLALARRMMRAAGGEVRLGAEGEPARRPWARTELVVDLAADAEAPAPRVADPAPARRWRRAVALALAAALAAAVVGLAWLGLERRLRGGDAAAEEVADAATPATAAPRPDRVTVAEVSGAVERLEGGAWAPVAAGERLHEDDTVRAGPGGGAVIAVGPRSRVTVSASTQLTVRELTAAVHRLRLSRGRISVDHQPDGARVLVVESERGEKVARAGAARFSVLASGAALAVATETGVVRLQAAGRDVEVGPGQQSVAVGAAAPAAPQQIPVALLLEVARSARLRDGTCGVEGRAGPGAEVRVDGQPVQVEPDGRFAARVPVAAGTRDVPLAIRDAAGRTRERRAPCTVEKDPAEVSDFAVRWGEE